MTESELNKFSIDELFDILMTSTKELVELVKEKNTARYEAVKKQVQFLQRVIVAKRAAFQPLI